MEKCLVRPIKACRKRRSPLTSKFSKKFTPVTFRNHVTFSQSKNAGPPVSCSESNQLHSKVANRQYKDMSFGIIVDQKNPFPSATKSDDEVTLPLDSDDFFEMARSSLIGKQVICQEDGRILGFATQLCVDWDMLLVYGLLVREFPLFGRQAISPWEDVFQVGDVILVNSGKTFRRRPRKSSFKISQEVITEKGEFLGRVRDFTFQPETKKLTGIILDEFGQPMIPTNLVNAYRVPISEILSTFPDQLIVKESAFDQWEQLSTGIVEKAVFGEQESSDSEMYFPKRRADFSQSQRSVPARISAGRRKQLVRRDDLL